MRWSLLSLCFAGCALATSADHQGNDHTDGGFTHADSSIKPLDAFVNHVDAPARPADQDPRREHQRHVAAPRAGSRAPAADEGTTANNYYRVFDPSTFGISTAFHVTQISFQVEDCESAAE